jgi:hypothetical protein
MPTGSIASNIRYALRQVAYNTRKSFSPFLRCVGCAKNSPKVLAALSRSSVQRIGSSALTIEPHQRTIKSLFGKHDNSSETQNLISERLLRKPASEVAKVIDDSAAPHTAFADVIDTLRTTSILESKRTSRIKSQACEAAQALQDWSKQGDIGAFKVVGRKFISAMGPLIDPKSSQAAIYRHLSKVALDASLKVMTGVTNGQADQITKVGQDIKKELGDFFLTAERLDLCGHGLLMFMGKMHINQPQE